MNDYNVYGVGNAMVDTEYEVNDEFLQRLSVSKGIMSLIDDDRKAALISELDNQFTLKNRTGGGSAANTMVAVCQFGGTAFYSCRVGDDDVGDFFRSDLDRIGVHSNLGSKRNAGITGQCLVMITPDAERSMNTCLGISGDLASTDLLPDAIRSSDYLYLEGYLASSETAREVALEAREIARKAGVKVSLTLSDPAMVSGFRDVFEQFTAGGVDLIFCNREEALIWSNRDSLDAATEELKKSARTFVITLGAEGALVYDGHDCCTIESYPITAIDSNGAGDMFAGAFLYGLTHGHSYANAADLANRSAAHLVSQFGARLQREEQQQLMQAGK
jgi:fructokinase|tara:strand:+ start:14160 stop:15155 length:996 start_codon:yes stop_codon:yes gene_type:complete